MASYAYLRGLNHPFVPHIGFACKIQFSHNNPRQVRGRDLIFCQCNLCLCCNRHTEYFESRGLIMAHGNEVTRDKVKFAFQIFLATNDYRQELHKSVQFWHIVLLAHEGMYVVRAVSGILRPMVSEANRPWCYFHQCSENETKDHCWVKNHYFTHWTCVCMKHCYSFDPSTYTKSIGLYKGFGGLTDSDKLIDLPFIYRVCGILLAWISRPEVNGPPQLGLLAGSLAETLLLHDQYTGTVPLEGMNNRLMYRTRCFLTKEEILFPMYLDAHLGLTLVLNRPPQRRLDNQPEWARQTVVFDEWARQRNL